MLIGGYSGRPELRKLSSKPTICVTCVCVCVCCTLYDARYFVLDEQNLSLDCVVTGNLSLLPRHYRCVWLKAVEAGIRKLVLTIMPLQTGQFDLAFAVDFSASKPSHRLYTDHEKYFNQLWTSYDFLFLIYGSTYETRKDRQSDTTEWLRYDTIR